MTATDMTALLGGQIGAEWTVRASNEPTDSPATSRSGSSRRNSLG
jgi:hypothetical protein